MSALGDTFRTARESQGLTLSDVAERIHIRSLYLAAIEAEDWNAIGPPVYIRGFVRTYARCLGLDPDAAVARFADRSGASPAPPVILAPSPRGEPSVSGLSRGEARKPGLSPAAIVGVLVAFALVLFVGYEYVEYQHQRPQPAAGDVNRSSAKKERAAAPPESNSQVVRHTLAGSIAAKSEDRSSSFELRLRDNSWLKVVVDGKLEMEGVFTKGTSRAFTGRSATVRTGNAGGVEISVDGKALGPMGGLGDVAERSFQL